MRQIYETDSSLEAERKIVQDLCDKWKVNCAKLPISYNVDYCLLNDGKLRAWLEVKCRYCTSVEYPTYFISAKKIFNGLQMSEASGVPFILAVRWEDKLGFIRVLKGSYKIKIGGRKDRNDWQDVEPMAHFNIKDFTMIEVCDAG